MSARRAEIEAKRAKLERMRQERAARQQRAQGLGESQGKQEVGPPVSYTHLRAHET